MKKNIIIATVILAIAAASALFQMNNVLETNPVHAIPQQVIIAFTQWKMTQKRLYASPEENTHRLSVFHANYQKVESVNSQGLTYTLKLNDFADLSHEEFVATYLQKEIAPTEVDDDVPFSTGEELSQERIQQPIANDFNWCGLTYNKCSAVRRQGTCASGYAFAAAKAMEYYFNIQGQNSNRWLSPQEYIDCSVRYGNQGCQGGLPFNAIKYSFVYGLGFDSNYPYVDVQQSCKSVSYQFKPKNYIKIARGDNQTIEKYLRTRPLAVGLDASYLQFYNGGIYNGPCSTTQATHFMTLIGYGTQDTTPYWRLENSWGTNWGMGGYIFMKKEQGRSSSPCGLPNNVDAPTL